MQIDPENLSEHDKQMIAVAENGDPNDPSETNTADDQSKEGTEESGKFELPEGFESYEELVEAARKAREAEANEEEEGEAEDDAEEGDEAEADEAPEGPSKEELEIRELKAYEAVGGREEYGKMVEYAKANLSEEQLAIYDQAVTGLDRNVAMLAVNGLHAMYKLNAMETLGTEGQMSAPGGGTTGLTGYATMSDMMKDMADPRYQTDETFVAQVAQRVALSNF